MSDESAEPDTDLRRRAAWLLAMLVLVAVLVVVVMTTLLGTDKGSTNSAPIGPDPITSTGPAPATSRTSSASTPTSSTSSGPTTGASSSAGSTAPAGSATCPTSAPCALDADVGGALAAINAYRQQHGKPAVPGSVTDAAKTCALNRGNGCTGGWAETEISAPPDGTLAVQKIIQFAKLLDPQMKAVAIGWAYFPSSKTYALATIRQD